MQAFTPLEASRELGWTVPLTADSPARGPVVEVGGPFDLPGDSGTKTAMARALSRILLARGGAVVLFTGWGVWPSSEHRDLFYGYMRSLGETRCLADAPVYLFSPGDESELISTLALGFYFLWDFTAGNVDGRLLVVSSHDEWLEFRSAERGNLAGVIAWADSFGLDPLGTAERAGREP